MRDRLAAPVVASVPLHDIEAGWRRNHRRPPITLPCVCGGPEIVAMSTSHEDVTEGVQRHQVEPVHIAYDNAHGIPLSRAQLVAHALDAVSS